MEVAFSTDFLFSLGGFFIAPGAQFGSFERADGSYLYSISPAFIAQEKTKFFQMYSLPHPNRIPSVSVSRSLLAPNLYNLVLICPFWWCYVIQGCFLSGCSWWRRSSGQVVSALWKSSRCGQLHLGSGKNTNSGPKWCNCGTLPR